MKTIKRVLIKEIYVRNCFKCGKIFRTRAKSSGSQTKCKKCGGHKALT